ncbi:energy-coupling factor transporter transmembrane protein EcfT [uncultured Kocuria sp.]|uniref:energy-coupling factor transporter transmembrane component T family protein n=1 Tax=uncultured Kocuria sp. TaxID=259305 RepID=UPI00262C1B40|nr:energy-coupling factor transporter transmembrane component T [uncultured Kocuria sp.]
MSAPAMAPSSRTSLLGRTNAVVKLAGALLLTVVLLLSADPVTSGTVLLGEVLLLALAGQHPFALLRRAWPVVVAALVSGWGTALLAEDSGPVLLDLGVTGISAGSVAAGAAIALRGLALALPGLMLVLTTDPTDLADGLAQTLRLPARFVLASLAALRLVGVMVSEWATLAMARRARGAGSGYGPVGALREFGGQAFTLLVQSLRRATRLSVTMEARGFGAGPRTWARVPGYSWRDAVVLAGCAAAAAAGPAVSVLLGTHRFIWA